MASTIVMLSETVPRVLCQHSKSSHIAKYRLGNADDGRIEVTMNVPPKRRERLECLE